MSLAIPHVVQVHRGQKAVADRVAAGVQVGHELQGHDVVVVGEADADGRAIVASPG